MKEVIPKNKVYSFKIKITNTQKSDLMLGVVDRLIGKDKQLSHYEKYAIYFHCYDGKVFPNSLRIYGVKVNKGETVEVVVDLSKSKVEFKVSDIIKATVNNYKILTETNR
jgi:hypothetical protein